MLSDEAISHLYIEYNMPASKIAEIDGRCAWTIRQHLKSKGVFQPWQNPSPDAVAQRALTNTGKKRSAEAVANLRAGQEKEEHGYHAVHFRLTRDRGRAADQLCNDCGLLALHWSYDWEDPNELTDKGKIYSRNQDHYQPRCQSCHFALDRFRWVTK